MPEFITTIDWIEIYYNIWHLILAFALAIPIGYDRQQSSRNFGLRTFPLVAVVSCGFMMVGMSVIDTTDGEARIFQGIVTGIGGSGPKSLDSVPSKLSSHKSKMILLAQ